MRLISQAHGLYFAANKQKSIVINKFNTCVDELLINKTCSIYSEEVSVKILNVLKNHVYFQGIEL